MENPIKMDDLGVPLFLETPISFWMSSQIFHPPPQKKKKMSETSMSYT